MKTSWTVEQIHKYHASCRDNKYFTEMSCLCDPDEDGVVELADFIRDMGVTPHDKLYWLKERAMNILEWEQLGLYLKRRYWDLFKLKITVEAAVGFYDRSKSPLLDKSEIENLVYYLKL